MACTEQVAAFDDTPLLRCLGLGKGEVVWSMAHGMCITWIIKNELRYTTNTPPIYLLYLSVGLIPIRLPHMSRVCQSAENITVCDPWFNEAPSYEHGGF